MYKFNSYLGLLNICFIFTTYGCSVQPFTVSHVDNVPPDKKADYYYAIPKNKIVVTIPILRAEFRAGPYDRFARENSILTNRLSTDSYISKCDEDTKNREQRYSIGKPSIQLNSILDADQIYALSRNRFSSIDNYKLEFNRNGLVFFFNENKNNMDLLNTDSAIEKLDLSSSISAKSKVLFTSGVSTKFEKIADRKITASVEELKKLYDLRMIALDIGVSSDSESALFENIMNEINKEEDEILKLFKGEIFYEYINVTFEFVPNTDFAGQQTWRLFNFSECQGVLKDSEISTSSNNVETLSFTISTSENSKKILNKISNHRIKVMDKNGIVYRIPAEVVAKIYSGSENISSSNHLISQFGLLINVSPNQLSDYMPDFYQDTGSIKTIKF